MFKKLKPVTPSLRHSFTIIKNISKYSLLKNKIKNNKRALGRGSGKILSKYKEGGAKKKYRILTNIIDETFEGTVCSLEYDPNRSGFIMSIFDKNSKNFCYSLAQENVLVGDSIIVTDNDKIVVKNGDKQLIKNLPPGTLVSNVPLKTGETGKIARSAGSYCVLKGHLESFAFIELMSGEIRLLPSMNFVSVGKISNDYHFLEQGGKAGRSRWKGCRPKTRGVAMNPVDHPNGGGEGKKSGKGRTPWGRPGKGIKTSSSRNKLILKSSRNEPI